MTDSATAERNKNGGGYAQCEQRKQTRQEGQKVGNNTQTRTRCAEASDANVQRSGKEERKEREGRERTERGPKHRDRTGAGGVGVPTAEKVRTQQVDGGDYGTNKRDTAK
jgi:hypothetical protein